MSLHHGEGDGERDSVKRGKSYFSDSLSVSYSTPNSRSSFSGKTEASLSAETMSEASPASSLASELFGGTRMKDLVCLILRRLPFLLCLPGSWRLANGRLRRHLQKSATNCNLTDVPRRAWRLKIFKMGKLRSVILFDLSF